MPDIVNPLLETWNTPFDTPPFGRIAPEHFRPAFDIALAEHRTEIDAIRDAPTEPTFDNVVVAMERAGASLRRVSSVFFNLSAADTSPALQAIERDMAPLLSRHSSSIYLDAALFGRIDALYQRRAELGLNLEQLRLLERYRLAFVRSGAQLPEKDRTRLAEISQRLAELGTAFSQNVLADESSYGLVLDSADDLAGLPDFARKGAARAANDRGFPGKHVITLSRSSIEPFLHFSARRDLREKAFNAWIMRGQGGGGASLAQGFVGERDQGADRIVEPRALQPRGGLVGRAPTERHLRRHGAGLRIGTDRQQLARDLDRPVEIPAPQPRHGELSARGSRAGKQRDRDGERAVGLGEPTRREQRRAEVRARRAVLGIARDGARQRLDRGAGLSQAASREAEQHPRVGVGRIGDDRSLERVSSVGELARAVAREPLVEVGAAHPAPGGRGQIWQKSEVPAADTQTLYGSVWSRPASLT
jgi:hypothetical protein